jgi:ATP-dependent RNA helicase DDX55/SPB4
VVAGTAAATALDNEREKQRASRAEKKKLNSAWSEKVVKREERDKRKEKRSAKRKWLKTQAAEAAPSADQNQLKRGRSEDGGGDKEDDEDDWDELAREERMAKKVRKGDIDQKTFDAEFGDLS